jgi:hypothetical protein
MHTAAQSSWTNCQSLMGGTSAPLSHFCACQHCEVRGPRQALNMVHSHPKRYSFGSLSRYHPGIVSYRCSPEPLSVALVQCQGYVSRSCMLLPPRLLGGKCCLGRTLPFLIERSDVVAVRERVRLALHVDTFYADSVRAHSMPWLLDPFSVLQGCSRSQRDAVCSVIAAFVLLVGASVSTTLCLKARACLLPGSCVSLCLLSRCCLCLVLLGVALFQSAPLGVLRPKPRWGRAWCPVWFFFLPLSPASLHTLLPSGSPSPGAGSPCQAPNCGGEHSRALQGGNNTSGIPMGHQVLSRGVPEGLPSADRGPRGHVIFPPGA